MTRRELERINKLARGITKIDPNKEGSYNVLDLLKLPFSDEYMSILRRYNTEEEIDYIKHLVKQRNG